MEGYLWGVLVPITLAVLGFPFVVVARRPDKLHSIVRSLQLFCLIAMSFGGGFGLGAHYGQKHYEQEGLVDMIGGSIWIIFFVILAYVFALEVVKRYLHD